MRLIDADALIEEIAKIKDLRTLSTKTIGEAIDRVPQKTGKWIEKNRVYSEESNIEDWQSCCCSVCGHYDTRPYMYYFDEPNYCSYCGARMVGDGE